MKKVTELELKVITSLSFSDEFDEMPCADFDYLIEDGITKDVLKGVLSSLIKKEIVSLGEYPNGLTAYYLQDKDFYN